MGRRLATGLMLLGMLVGVLVGTAGPVAADSNYTCPDKSCGFTVPDSYSALSNDATSVIFKDSVSGGAFTATTTAFPGTLDDASSAVTSQFSAQPGYQVDPRGTQNATLGDQPARSYYFMSTNDSGAAVETLIFFSVNQGKLYLLSFSTTPDGADAFYKAAQPVFDSWKFM